MDSIWNKSYSTRAENLSSSEIRELLHLVDQPGVISFAGGLPAPEVFPLKETQEACTRLMKEHGEQALQYGTTEGYVPLREMICRHMSRYGIESRPSNILVTSGAQQALDLVGKLFLDAGDTVLVEDPTYLGAIQAFRAYQVRFASIPTDDDGIRTEVLEETLERVKPKIIYLLPNFQNPSGVTMSEMRRRQIVRLAARFQIPIIEDDPYGQLRYTGTHKPPLFALDAELDREPHTTGACGRHVLYISTLSKLLAPGLRIGWLTGPEKVISRFVQIKQGMDLHTSTFAQMLAAETCHGGFLDRHVRFIRKVYSERRDAMLSALQSSMPEGVDWTKPEGGLFLWVRLPAVLDAREVLRIALEKRVAFVPGGAFFANGGGQNTLRLNFSYSQPEKIAVGVERLAESIVEAMSAQGLPT